MKAIIFLSHWMSTPFADSICPAADKRAFSQTHRSEGASIRKENAKRKTKPMNGSMDDWTNPRPACSPFIHSSIHPLILILAFFAALRCYAAVPGAALFADKTVRTFKIEIVGEQLEALKKDNRNYVRATV